MTAEDRQLLDEYARAPQRVREAVAGLSREELLATPVPGKWSTQQVIIHLADADIAFAHRLKRILAEDKPSYSAWSENGFVDKLAYDRQSVEDALLQIEVLHRQMLRALEAQPAGWLERTGVHNLAGEQTARKVLASANWHIAHHLKFVKDKRERLGKPLAG